MQKYESIFVGQPLLSSEDFQSLLQSFEQTVAGAGGSMVRAETWGKRRLAHTIKKHEEGHYGFLLYEGSGATVKELERQFRLHEDVIKFISVAAPPEGLRIVGGMEIRPSRPESEAPAEGAEAPPEKRPETKPETADEAPAPKPQEEQA